ncbi:hypothetical protein IMSAG049_00163 [Clostridiales bacterium]|nr:hypothetical protein IMSAG049_00163 [Clostridiales bacterium]
MERESFVFYRSFFEAIRLQPKRVQADIYNAVMDYAFYGKEPEKCGAALGLFLLIKPQLDANNKRYENGKKGGRKTGGSKKEEPKPNQTVTQTEPNENVNENDNENINANGNEKENGAKRHKRKDFAVKDCSVDADASVCISAPSGEKKYFPLDEKLNEAFGDFIKMRRQIKKPMTPKAIELMTDKINALGDNNLAIDCLNESIIHCWQDIYPNKTVRASPKGQQGAVEKSSNPFFDIYNRLVEEEENEQNRNSSSTYNIESCISEVLC